MCLLRTRQGSFVAEQQRNICKIPGPCDAPSKRLLVMPSRVAAPNSVGTDATSFTRSKSWMSGRSRGFQSPFAQLLTTGPSAAQSESIPPERACVPRPPSRAFAVHENKNPEDYRRVPRKRRPNGEKR